MKKVKLVVLSLTLVFTILFMNTGNAFAISSEYKTSPYYSKLCNIVKTGNQRTDIVNIALSQVGYQEGSVTGTSKGSNNVTEYGNWVGAPGKSWCAAFIAWCGNLAGISTSEIRETASPSGLCPSWEPYFSTSAVQVGDILNINNGAHSALVWKVDGTYIYTVEGNMSNRVRSDITYSANTGKCTWNNYDAKISSFYSPKYKVTPSVPALDNKINLTSSFPSTGITAGTDFKITGTVTSNYKVGSVTATITGNGISQHFDSGVMEKDTYDLSNLNQNLKIRNLPSGTYTLTINMINVATSTVGSTLLTKKWIFKVIPSVPALDNKINLTSSLPSTGITEGTDFKITGTVTSNYKVGSVTATITGNGISQHFDSGVMEKDTYDLSNLNQNLKIRNLPSGTYTLTINMVNVATSTVGSALLTKKWTFKVIPSVPALDNKINLTSSLPSTGITEGTDFKITGTVTSNYKVGSVTATITGNGISQHFDSGIMEKDTYDLSNLNQNLKIRNLPSGTYTLTINMVNVATSTVGSTLLTKKWTFKVIPATVKHTVVVDKSVNATYTQTGLTEGSHCSVCGEVLKKQTIIPMKTITAPKISSIVNNTDKGVTVKWSRVTGATGYKVYRNGHLVKTLSQGTFTSWSDIYANTNGSKYQYKVAAFAAVNRNEVNSSKASSIKTTYKLSRPVMSSVTNKSARKIAVKWTRNSEATGYEVKCTDGKTAKTILVKGNVNVTRVLSSLTKGKTYKVNVRSYKLVSGVKYYSAWSAEKSIKVRR